MKNTIKVILTGANIIFVPGLLLPGCSSSEQVDNTDDQKIVEELIQTTGINFWKQRT